MMTQKMAARKTTLVPEAFLVFLSFFDDLFYKLCSRKTFFFNFTTKVKINHKKEKTRKASGTG